ncbi:hypothetical protein BD413DRAFT_567804 [Trametes elegans]|nr:hypothetical protein BD413DRAFT_567804 [Trametes elegans]
MTVSLFQMKHIEPEPVARWLVDGEKSTSTGGGALRALPPIVRAGQGQPAEDDGCCAKECGSVPSRPRDHAHPARDPALPGHVLRHVPSSSGATRFTLHHPCRRSVTRSGRGAGPRGMREQGLDADEEEVSVKPAGDTFPAY